MVDPSEAAFERQWFQEVEPSQRDMRMLEIYAHVAGDIQEYLENLAGKAPTSERLDTAVLLLKIHEYVSYLGAWGGAPAEVLHLPEDLFSKEWASNLRISGRK